MGTITLTWTLSAVPMEQGEEGYFYGYFELDPSAQSGITISVSGDVNTNARPLGNVFEIDTAGIIKTLAATLGSACPDVDVQFGIRLDNDEVTEYWMLIPPEGTSGNEGTGDPHTPYEVPYAAGESVSAFLYLIAPTEEPPTGITVTSIFESTDPEWDGDGGGDLGDGGGSSFAPEFGAGASGPSGRDIQLDADGDWLQSGGDTLFVGGVDSILSDLKARLQFFRGNGF